MGCNLLTTLLPDNIPGLSEYVQKGIALNTRVLGFTSISALLAALVFGLAPALRALKPDVQEALKEGGRSSTERFGLRRRRSLLVMFGIATALVLLIGAGLMINSFLRLKGPYAGLDPQNVMITEITLDDKRYSGFAQIHLYWEDLLQRIRNLPGVRSVAAVANLLGDMWWMTYVGVTVEGHPTLRIPHRGAHCNPITLDYLQTMRIPLRKGRYFTEQDMKPAPAVAIVNESFVKHFFAKDEDPIGKEIRIIEVEDRSLKADATPGTSLGDVGYSIIGVVKDLKSNWEIDENAEHEIYFPYTQGPAVFKRPMRRLNLVVRTDSAPLSLVGAIRKTISALDKDQPMSNPVILERMDSDSLMPQRSLAVLIGIFALVAVGLASIGIYGVMSYFVTRRIHEIGIRMALGAQPHEVHWLVLRQGLKLTLIGLALGLVAALNLTKLLSSYIFGISPTDPGTFAIVSVVLTMVGLLASYIPARKATKVDPMVAFRSE
jgi:putative ABC transport system permease protein